MVANPLGQMNRFKDNTRGRAAVEGYFRTGRLVRHTVDPILRKKQPDLMGLALRGNYLAASRQLLADRTGHGREYVI